MNEFGLIQTLQKILGSRPRPKGLVQGIGDDTSVRRLSASRFELLTHDLLLEKIHFLAHSPADFEALGWKALVVNLSDIAAMGGKPVEALVGLGLPKRFSQAKLSALYRGLRRAARHYGCAVVGGDTNASKDGWVLAVTVVGESNGMPLRRSGVRPGDSLWVTGSLGGAALAWEALQRKKKSPALKPFLQCLHLPEARVLWGEKIRKSGLATAMIDVSDGVAGDVVHLAEASGVGFAIEVSRLPRVAALKTLAQKWGLSLNRLLLSGGEDYELLFTVRQGKEAAAQKFFKKQHIPATLIGTSFRGKGIGYFEDSRRLHTKFTGFRHF